MGLKVSRRVSRFELAGSPVHRFTGLPVNENVDVFNENHLISAKKYNFCVGGTQVFRKGMYFLRILRKDARFPRVEFVDFPNSSLHVHEKRTNSLNVHEKRTLSETGCHFANYTKKTYVSQG